MEKKKNTKENKKAPVEKTDVLNKKKTTTKKVVEPTKKKAAKVVEETKPVVKKASKKKAEIVVETKSVINNKVVSKLEPTKEKKSKKASKKEKVEEVAPKQVKPAKKASKKIEKPAEEPAKVAQEPIKQAEEVAKKPKRAKKAPKVEEAAPVEQAPIVEKPAEEAKPVEEKESVFKKSAKNKATNNKKVDSLLQKEEEEEVEPTPTMVIKHHEKASEKADFRVTALIAINIVLIAALATVGFLYFKGNIKGFSTNIVEREVLAALPKEADTTYQDIYNEYHDRAFVKDDYVGQIIFESGIINEPVMQGDTNETYLRRNFETYKYEVCGPVFADYICDVESDQNLILYGHNRSTGVDPEHVMMFSPLHVLEKEENYDANKLIYMAYEDRVDVYLVAAVYPIKVVEKEDGNQYLVKGEPLYYLDNYGVEEFNTYIDGVKQRQLYDTGVKLVNTDKLLTLQTCYEDKLDKLIILAKKVESLPYQKG